MTARAATIEPAPQQPVGDGDATHCPAVGSGGFHSESYLDGGRCAWCSAVTSPDDVTWWSTLCALCTEREGPSYQRCTCGECPDCGEALEHCACEHILIGDGVGDLDLLPTPSTSRNA